MVIESAGKRKYNIADKTVSLLFAVLVIVQPLRSFLPVSCSMAIILISAPYFLWGAIRYNRQFKYVLFVALYVGFRIFNHGTTFEECTTLVILLLFAMTLLCDRFDFECFLKWTVRIACIASVCVTLQVLVHTVTGVHIPFLSTGMIRDKLLGTEYRTLITTGLASGAYRPSAFFMEPSAFAAYCYPIIFYLLFKQRSSRGLKIALLISMGVVFTTSSMGLLLVVFMWGLFLFQASFRENKIKTKWFFIFCGAIVAAVIVFFVSSKVQFIVLRLFQGMGESRYSAIQGRVGGGQYYISQLNHQELLFGTGLTTEELTMFLSGIYSLIYTDGIVCAVLFELMFVSRLFFTKGFDRILLMIVIVLAVFSNTQLIHSVMYLMVYTFTEIEEIRVRPSRIRLTHKG